MDVIHRLEVAARHLPVELRAEDPGRAAELIDIEKQIFVRLVGRHSEPLQELTAPVIVLATDLLPSDTADFTPRTVHAFATESGGNTSHTAILAGALEIPAVVGLGRFSRSPITGRIAKGYVEFLRGTPLLFQLFVIFFGVPRSGPRSRPGGGGTTPSGTSRPSPRTGPGSGCSGTSSWPRRRPTA